MSESQSRLDHISHITLCDRESTFDFLSPVTIHFILFPLTRIIVLLSVIIVYLYL